MSMDSHSVESTEGATENLNSVLNTPEASLLEAEKKLEEEIQDIETSNKALRSVIDKGDKEKSVFSIGNA
jgi:hypothetical protein